MPERPSRAVILGSDWPLAIDGPPRGLTELDGKLVLDRQCEALAAAGIGDVVIVCGEENGELGRFLTEHRNVRHVLNPFSEIGGCLGALWFAQDEIEGSVLLLEGGMVASAEAIEAMMCGGMPIALGLSMHDAARDGDILIEGGSICGVGSRGAGCRPDARSLGVVALQAPGAARVREAILPMLEAPDGLAKGLIDVVADLAKELPIGFIALDGLDWSEVGEIAWRPSPVPSPAILAHLGGQQRV